MLRYEAFKLHRQQAGAGPAVTRLCIGNLYMGYGKSISFFRSSVLDIFRLHRHVRDARMQRTDPPHNTIQQK